MFYIGRKSFIGAILSQIPWRTFYTSQNRIWGFTNSTPLKNNLVLKTSKKIMYLNLVSKHMHNQES
jgi:hypothetical protein